MDQAVTLANWGQLRTDDVILYHDSQFRHQLYAVDTAPEVIAEDCGAFFRTGPDIPHPRVEVWLTPVDDGMNPAGESQPHEQCAFRLARVLVPRPRN